MAEPDLDYQLTWAQTAFAAPICTCRCSVQANCLSYTLITQPDGIWGGTTREERWRNSPSARGLPTGP
jgi:hypothetical protein